MGSENVSQRFVTLQAGNFERLSLSSAYFHSISGIWERFYRQIHKSISSEGRDGDTISNEGRDAETMMGSSGVFGLPLVFIQTRFLGLPIVWFGRALTLGS